MPIQQQQDLQGGTAPGEQRPEQVTPASGESATRVQQIPPAAGESATRVQQIPEHVPPAPPGYQQQPGPGYQQPAPGHEQPPPGYQPYPPGQPGGYPPGPQPYNYGPARPPQNPLAIASLVCGILWGYGFLSIVGLILGIVSLNKIKQSGESGRGMAIAGIVLGAVGIVGAIGFAIFEFFLLSQVRHSMPPVPGGVYPTYP